MERLMNAWQTMMIYIDEVMNVEAFQIVYKGGACSNNVSFKMAKSESNGIVVGVYHKSGRKI